MRREIEFFLNTSMALDFSKKEGGEIVGTRHVCLFSKDNQP